MTDLAKAIYFAAYYNPDNHFFYSYSVNFMITKQKWLGLFVKEWNRHREKDIAFDQLYYE